LSFIIIAVNNREENTEIVRGQIPNLICAVHIKLS
jgi:hypothetical protein